MTYDGTRFVWMTHDASQPDFVGQDSEIMIDVYNGSELLYTGTINVVCEVEDGERTDKVIFSTKDFDLHVCEYGTVELFPLGK